VIIYSVVRSNPEGNLGFLRSDRRLNVALSRGRETLVIVGDASHCAKVSGRNPLRRVLAHIRLHDTCAVREVGRGQRRRAEAGASRQAYPTVFY
jgi:hypothetical protein